MKHLTGVELGYFGLVFDRPTDDPLPDDTDDPLVDMWVRADEPREQVVAAYRRAWAHADATIAGLALDAEGRVPHWPAERATVTLHEVLVHMIAETHRHAGHADIVRELVDGSAGRNAPGDNLPDVDREWWAAHRDRVERAALEAR